LRRFTQKNSQRRLKIGDDSDQTLQSKVLTSPKRQVENLQENYDHGSHSDQSGSVAGYRLNLSSVVNSIRTARSRCSIDPGSGRRNNIRGTSFEGQGANDAPHQSDIDLHHRCCDDVGSGESAALPPPQNPCAATEESADCRLQCDCTGHLECYHRPRERKPSQNLRASPR
jgi:hypothetical protein